MNFQSVLIITYRRSGSTLLQGILNSHEELLIKGENYNFCYHLFEGYNALKKSKSKIKQELPSDPFFGNTDLDEAYYISKTSETVKRLLLTDHIKNPKVKAFGFKETRYEEVLEDLPAFLDFLKRIFPNPVFIFNTRNHDAVINSRLSLNWIKSKEIQKTLDSLTRVESIFSEYTQSYPNSSYQITYEDVISKSDRLQKLHSYLGLQYSESRMEDVLRKVHSYSPQQEEIRKKSTIAPSKVIQMPEENPLVTVLLCVYNGETYLREAIQSILDQTYKNIEFIILNDGSTDNTKQIIQSYDDPRIRYLEHSENKGLEDSKNWGLDEASGKYIAYMDGDDISTPERIMIQTKYMEENPDVGICASAVTFFGTKSAYYHPAETDMEIRGRALVDTPLCHPSCMIRTSVIKEHNIRYRKDFPAAEDHPFMVDLMMVSKAYCFPRVLLRYRWHDQNVSVTRKSVQAVSAQKALDSAFKKLADIAVTKKEKEAYKALWIGLYDPTNNEALESLKDKIYIDQNLLGWESEFRFYLKNRLEEVLDPKKSLGGSHQLLNDKALEIIQLKREKEKMRVLLHSANLELGSIFQSLSWKLTKPLRWIGKILFRMKARK